MLEASKDGRAVATGVTGWLQGRLSAALASSNAAKVEFLALATLLVVAVLLYNVTTIATSGNGIKHPDESATLLLSDNFLETGRLTYRSELNSAHDTTAFTPHGLSYDGDRVGPKKAYGIYVFTAGGLLLGDAGPFVLVSLALGVTVLFVYLTVRLFAEPFNAFAAAAMAGFSYPFIYWAQSLYGNPVSLAFFAGAVYLLARDVARGRSGEDVERSSYLRFAAIGLVLGLAALLRLEYVVFGGLLLGAIFLMPTTNRRNTIAAMAAFGTIVLLILALNWNYFGSPFSVAYTQATRGFEPASTSSDVPLYAIYDRFLRHDVDPDLGRLYRNTRDWLWGFAPVLLLLGTLGGALQLSQRGRSRGLWLGLALVAVLWSYDTLGGFHWGEGTGERGAVYGRYLLPTYYVLALAAPTGIAAIARAVERRAGALPIAANVRRDYVRYATAGVLIALTLVTTPILLFTGKGTMADDMDTKRFYHDLDQDVAQLPPDAVIVANLHGKGILSKPVMAYASIVGTDEERREETVRVVYELVTDGNQVYLLETSYHRATFLDIGGLMQNDERFDLQPLTVGNTQLMQVLPAAAGP